MSTNCQLQSVDVFRCVLFLGAFKTWSAVCRLKGPMMSPQIRLWGKFKLSSDWLRRKTFFSTNALDNSPANEDCGGGRGLMFQLSTVRQTDAHTHTVLSFTSPLLPYLMLKTSLSGAWHTSASFKQVWALKTRDACVMCFYRLG